MQCTMTHWLRTNILARFCQEPIFWHLAVNRAIARSSGFNSNLPLNYFAGRKDPQQVFQDLSFGPRFPQRMPQAFAFSEIQRVASRNGMSNFHASALLGGHTLGQAHPEFSGFRGSWDPTPLVFDNLYWQTLQKLNWQTVNVPGVNSETGQATNNLQYSLGGQNLQSSLQLFADVNQLVASTLASPCPAVHVFSPRVCPFTDPQIFTSPGSAQSVLSAWSSDASTFFAAFDGAWQELSQWGCASRQCPQVAPLTTPVQCTNVYHHTCDKIFKNGVPPPWDLTDPQVVAAGITTQSLLDSEVAFNNAAASSP